MQKIDLGKKLKEQFPIFKNNLRIEQGQQKPLIYLDSAVSAHKPQSVIRSMIHNLEYEYGSVHRGAYHLSAVSSAMFEHVRQKVAQFVSKCVSPDQVIFTKGTTESLNLVANGFARALLSDKDRIVIPTSEHHANLVPWQQAALAADCEIAYIPIEKKQTTAIRLNLSEAQKLITPNTKVVSLASMGNVLGQINPVAEIVEIAKKVGAYVVLDCAQSASCLEQDYFAMGVDALAFSGHKVYGPSGIGVLVLSSELSQMLPPLLYGGGMISSVSLAESTWLPSPAKFEAGTPPISEVAGLGAALDWLNAVGRENIHKHASQLNTHFLQGLQALPEIEVFTAGTGLETLVSFRHRKIHSHDLVTILDAANVCMRAGHHCAWPLIQDLGIDALVRASFAAYSDVEDVETALLAIKNSSKFI